MAGLKRRLPLTLYGADELLLASLTCAAVALALFGLARLLGLPALLALLPLAPWLVVLWFFRDPERSVPGEPGLLVSPADGTVRDIQEVAAPGFVGARALRIGIFLSPLNVHVNRAPCGGRVEHVRYQPGRFLAAYDPAASEKNEACELGLVTPEGTRILVRQIAGVLARRVVCRARQGDELARGARYGMIKFGSRTELYVPLDGAFRVEVSVGQPVRGGVTVLCRRVEASLRET